MSGRGRRRAREARFSRFDDDGGVSAVVSLIGGDAKQERTTGVTMMQLVMVEVITGGRNRLLEAEPM
ncbi:hypothetical protein GUJ93_ZPchr0006g41221 [Zizania palustris]|uniref:Uncharacterized protein n=1 Tax=Zizania palustris TaxID=103762 RepID=A0A8J5TC77_ZIZPA|nr:hypothetical protein GUJ93_ZPchr0006g41221 [Zizania palustris]